MRPRRALEWSEDEDGLVTVLRPKFGPGRVGRWLSRRLPNPYLAVRLDGLGSFVWKRCDGEHTVGQIARELVTSRGDAEGDVRARLEVFVDRMRRRGMISD